jgi:small subunit ribosomal protein S8
MPPIVDLIIRIKNGYMSKKGEIDTPYSSFRNAVLTKLKNLGYIEDFSVEGEIIKNATITLKYDEGVAALTDVKLFSTPGRRWYVSVDEIKPVLGGMGHAIISTPKGILTDKEAKKQKVGGELLFQIW